ncbi:MAG: hypothetical protein MUF31_13165 [Akkermansiaceae bacterium]|nr:hypothetical protein [Akkermansiaceae bacterium]
MAIKIEMPKLSDTMTEGTLIKWHKQVGDQVEIGDIIAEVETDKATMEMEAFDEGTITEILVQEGEKAPIGGILAVLDGDGAAPAATPAPAAAVKSAPTAAASPASPVAAAPAKADLGQGDSRLKASPLARKIAAEKVWKMPAAPRSQPPQAHKPPLPPDSPLPPRLVPPLPHPHPPRPRHPLRKRSCPPPRRETSASNSAPCVASLPIAC